MSDSTRRRCLASVAGATGVLAGCATALRRDDDGRDDELGGDGDGVVDWQYAPSTESADPEAVENRMVVVTCGENRGPTGGVEGSDYDGRERPED